MVIVLSLSLMGGGGNWEPCNHSPESPCLSVKFNPPFSTGSRPTPSSAFPLVLCLTHAADDSAGPRPRWSPACLESAPTWLRSDRRQTVSAKDPGLTKPTLQPQLQVFPPGSEGRGWQPGSSYKSERTRRQKSLVGYSPQVHKKLDTTEQQTHTSVNVALHAYHMVIHEFEKTIKWKISVF